MVKNEKNLQLLSKQKVNHRCLVFITPRSKKSNMEEVKKFWVSNLKSMKVRKICASDCLKSNTFQKYLWVCTILLTWSPKQLQVSDGYLYSPKCTLHEVASDMWIHQFSWYKKLGFRSMHVSLHSIFCGDKATDWLNFKCCLLKVFICFAIWAKRALEK